MVTFACVHLHSRVYRTVQNFTCERGSAFHGQDVLVTVRSSPVRLDCPAKLSSLQSRQLQKLQTPSCGLWPILPKFMLVTSYSSENVSGLICGHTSSFMLVSRVHCVLDKYTINHLESIGSVGSSVLPELLLLLLLLLPGQQ